MRLAELNPGDLIEANVRGVKFRATVERVNRGLAKIEPAEPSRYSWRFLGPRQIVRKVGTQERLV